MDDLIKALQIFLKYGNPRSPTNCDHDMLRVMVDPVKVSEEDQDALVDLGFHSDYRDSCFYSIRFGSA